MDRKISLQRLRDAIPKKCFQPSSFRSGLHIVTDLVLSGALAGLALRFIPQIEVWSLRVALWMTYGYVQGLIFTGIWILAHECGHQALFKSNFTNDTLGFVLHSALLVPYFSWKYTHARHHRYHNHMEKDTAFVPNQKGESTWSMSLAKLNHNAEDAPLVTAAMLAGHQLLGWQTYVMSYASGGTSSTPQQPNGKLLDRSHLNPAASLWTPSQRFYIALSTAGMIATGTALYFVSKSLGFQYLALLYFVPYLWLNNWIIAITYLHHTHRDVPHFDADGWTYVDGALGTVDRPFGFVGKHLFHGIIDYHVIHHLFPYVPNMMSISS